MKDPYQEIGQAALAVADDLTGKLLLYCEVQEGVISAEFFYVCTADVVRYRVAPSPIRELVWSFWRQWRTTPGNSEWRAMAYVIDRGKFHVDFVYPEQIDQSNDVFERRPAVIKQYFGDTKVDYSRPR